MLKTIAFGGKHPQITSVDWEQVGDYVDSATIVDARTPIQS